MRQGGFALANRQSTHNADDSRSQLRRMPSGESTLQITRLTAFCRANNPVADDAEQQLRPQHQHQPAGREYYTGSLEADNA